MEFHYWTLNIGTTSSVGAELSAGFFALLRIRRHLISRYLYWENSVLAAALLVVSSKDVPAAWALHACV